MKVDSMTLIKQMSCSFDNKDIKSLTNNIYFWSIK